MIRRIALASLLTLGTGLAHADPAEDYATHCADCHGIGRLGGVGPALIPQTLRRMRGPNIENVIAVGRPSTQMPEFASELDSAAIAALAEYLKVPLDTIPEWGPDQVEASRELRSDYVAADSPVFTADPLNITLAVETGDHHISVLDGDTFEVLDRFETPFTVHGGPKFTPDGRYMFIASRDGYVQKYDIWSLQEVGRVRAGLNSRNIAMSRDGKHLAVANYLPMTLTLLSTDDLRVEKVMPVISKTGIESRVSAVYQAPQRDSFILALKDAPEIWEVATGPDALFADGTVQGADNVEITPATGGLFARRRIEIAEPLDDFFFTDDYSHLVGASRDGARGVVVNLDAGREIAELPLPGMPHLGSGISWELDGRRVMVTPHLKEGKLSVIDTTNWQVLKTIDTEGPGFFLRSHENSRYFWADVFFGPNKDVMHVIDKTSLEIVKTMRPEPGATVAHVEFTRDGSHALVSIWEDDGAVIIYDANTLEEIRRLPMRKPSGKYNVFNKISFSEGTSH